MDVVTGNTLLPGDPRLIDHIVCELKSQGTFDKFRKECIADVDTKPAYQNLRQRVEGSVIGFLKQQTWRPDMNKNQLREMLRKNIYESGFLETGVERIVDQVVNPKINAIFLPKVEEAVYNFLGLTKPNRNLNNNPINGPLSINTVDLLPIDLDPISPDTEVLEKNVKIEIKSEIVEETNKMDDSKIDEFESPPFEPLTEQSFTNQPDESSNDSHISGISGLTSHDSNMSESVEKMNIPIHEDNQDSQLSKVSSSSRLSIITNDSKHTPEKMDISDDTQSSKIEEISYNNPNVIESIIPEDFKDELEQIRMEINGQNKIDPINIKIEEKVDIHAVLENDEFVSIKEEFKIEIKTEDSKKPELPKEKNEKNSEKHRSDSDKRRHSESKDRKDNNKKTDKDRKDRDKYYKSSSSKDKYRDKSKDKDSKSKDSKNREEKTDKSKDSSKSEKDRKTSTSSNSKHSTSRDSRDKSTSKSSHSRDHSRDHSKSSKDHKSSSRKSSESSSKSKSRDHSTSKHSSSKSRKSSTSKDYNDKKDSKKENKREKDDHSSSKDKKNENRRSADRDSNDGSSGMPNSSSTNLSKNSETNNTTSSTTTNIKSEETSGSNTSNDSGQSDTADVTQDTAQKTESENVPKMLKKPKIASNIFEVRKLMKIRKKMEKMEKKRQRSQELITENKNDNSSDCSNYIDADDNDSKDSDSLQIVEEDSDEDMKEEAEIVCAPVNTSVVSKESWDAVEAKLNQSAYKNVDFNAYTDDSTSSTKINDQSLNNSSEEEDCLYFNNQISPSTERFLKSVELFQKDTVLNIDNKKSSNIDAKLTKRTRKINHKTQMHNDSQITFVPLAKNENFTTNQKKTKGTKRKLNKTEIIDNENNNKKVNSTSLVIDVSDDSGVNLQSSSSITNLSNGSFDSTTSKTKIRNRKNKKLHLDNISVTSSPGTENSEFSETNFVQKDEKPPVKTPRGSNLKNQRYSSDDLYKPRPFVSGTSRRQRGLLNNADKNNT